ncbi:hypothetical protein LTSEINV_6523 [Salmonella enterica subsp. enterica serovar Inverness str. R8-3668]|uniref:Uncharacterized protein n=1 Tax=Salmonella enterica subsp. enterica serovar Inverness str. R8-3668 TaxID=913075 RepID=G5NM74_SALET|nr:hypothetical protein LTSEINV_6523 [Salmonella enterica subsp. enterica serovar Inverness str. R8-3668]
MTLLPVLTEASAVCPTPTNTVANSPQVNKKLRLCITDFIDYFSRIQSVKR